MKKSLSKFLCIMMVISSVFVMPQITLAVDPDPLPIVAPADTVPILQDDFTAADNTKIENYTGGTGFVAPTGTVTTAYAGDYLLTTNCALNKLIIKNNQLTTAASQTNGGFYLYRGLTTPIALNEDAEYYITFRTNTPWNQYNSNATLGFGIPTNNQQMHAVGLGVSGGIYYSGTGAAGIVSFSTGQAIFGNVFSNRTLATANTGKMYTVVARLSTRAGKRDIMRVKSFLDGEQPTFTPATWDLENATDNAGVMSWLRLGMNNGTNLGYFPILDNLAVYKGAPVYVTKTYDGEWAVAGQTITISVPATNVLGHAQSIQSIDWTKNTSTVIGTPNSATYVVTADMVGQLIDAKVMLLDTITGTTTEYHPISQYVRSNYDVGGILYSGIYNTASDTNFVGLNPTLELNTNIQANVYLARNNNSSLGLINAPAKAFLVQYGSDNSVKNVASAVCDTSLIWERQLWNYAVKLQNITIAPTDYFKVFVWDSLSGLKPITQNKNSVEYPIYQKYPLNLN